MILQYATKKRKIRVLNIYLADYYYYLLNNKRVFSINLGTKRSQSKSGVEDTERFRFSSRKTGTIKQRVKNKPLQARTIHSFDSFSKLHRIIK